MSHTLNSVSRLVCLVMLSAVLVACVNRESARVMPNQSAQRLQSFYVIRFTPDTRGINRIIADELVQMGYRATTGEADSAPADVDAYVTYRDRWMWDITMYMLELTVTFRDPDDETPIATGNSYHTSLSRRSPTEMVREVLDNIFAELNDGGS